MDKLAEIWTFLTTPGADLPIGTTVIVLGVIMLCAFLLPSFVKWRKYRRENPMEDPRDKYRNRTNGNNTKSQNSSSQKKKK